MLPPPPSHPLRAVLLTDGNSTLPDRAHLQYKAQGGAMAAFGLHEQIRRYVSREKGQEVESVVLLFADVEQLSLTLSISSETLHNFGRGFSSTPSPCAFVNALKSSTFSAMNGHLSFLLPSLSIVFLAGFTTNTHAHHLRKVFPPSSAASEKVEFVLLETDQKIPMRMEGFARKRARFDGLMNVETVTVRKDVTNPPTVDEQKGRREAKEEVKPVKEKVKPVKEKLKPPPRPPSPRLVAVPVRAIGTFGNDAQPFAALAKLPPSGELPPVKTRSTSERAGGRNGVKEEEKVAAAGRPPTPQAAPSPVPSPFDSTDRELAHKLYRQHRGDDTFFPLFPDFLLLPSITSFSTQPPSDSAVAYDVAAWKADSRIAAIKLILSATLDLPKGEELEEDPAAYSREEYDDDFFDEVSSGLCCAVPGCYKRNTRKTFFGSFFDVLAHQHAEHDNLDVDASPSFSFAVEATIARLALPREVATISDELDDLLFPYSDAPEDEERDILTFSEVDAILRENQRLKLEWYDGEKKLGEYGRDWRPLICHVYRHTVSARSANPPREVSASLKLVTSEEEMEENKEQKQTSSKPSPVPSSVSASSPSTAPSPVAVAVPPPSDRAPSESSRSNGNQPSPTTTATAPLPPAPPSAGRSASAVINPGAFPSSPPSSTPAATPSVARPPAIPPFYAPLLGTILALESSPSASSPSWTAVGASLGPEPLAGDSEELRTLVLGAQRAGWVTTGKGEGGEGETWVKVSARGRRALGRT